MHQQCLQWAEFCTIHLRVGGEEMADPAAAPHPTCADPAALGCVRCGCGRHDGGSSVVLARVMADTTVTSDCGREARRRRIRPPLCPTHTARPPRRRA
uniref:Uncharacterized protein n=1 Tax=Oryza rufipogon TaxID=4529 RepID=A0A0E0N9V3_ORYRU